MKDAFIINAACLQFCGMLLGGNHCFTWVPDCPCCYNNQSLSQSLSQTISYTNLWYLMVGSRDQVDATDRSRWMLNNIWQLCLSVDTVTTSNESLHSTDGGSGPWQDQYANKYWLNFYCSITATSFTNTCSSCCHFTNIAQPVCVAITRCSYNGLISYRK